MAAGIAPRPFLLSRQNHLHGTVQTTNIDRLGCPDGISATWADIFPGTGSFGRQDSGCAAVCACSGYTITKEFVSVYQNVAQVIIQTELQETVTGRGMRPTVFVAVTHAQAARFCGFLEPLIVVGVAPAAILYPMLIVVIVHHLMQQSGGNFLDGARQCARADIDFMCAAQFGNPCILPEGKVAICLGGGLDGDGRS